MAAAAHAFAPQSAAAPVPQCWTLRQPLLYAALSFSHVEDEIGGFFTHCTDDSISQLDHRRVPA